MVHCLLTIKNHGGKKTHTIFFRQCRLPLLAAIWTASQKAGNSHLVTVLSELHFSLYINIQTLFCLFFFYISRRRRWHGGTEGLRQSNDLIAGKEERKAKAVILLYDIYLVVTKNYTQTQAISTTEDTNRRLWSQFFPFKCLFFKQMWKSYIGEISIVSHLSILKTFVLYLPFKDFLLH